MSTKLIKMQKCNFFKSVSNLTGPLFYFKTKNKVEIHCKMRILIHIHNVFKSGLIKFNYNIHSITYKYFLANFLHLDSLTPKVNKYH